MTPEALRRGSLFLLLIALTLTGRPRLIVTFLDVGDGDCTLVQSPEGRTILLDTGDSAAAPALAELLRRRGVRTIDLLILCAPGDSSIGGVPGLLGSGIVVSQIWDNSVPDTGSARRAAREALSRPPIPYSPASAGDTIQVGEKLFVSALWPPATGAAARRDPLLCRINFGSTALLLESTAPPEAERAVISQGGTQIGCTGECTDMILAAPTHAEGLPSAEMLRRAAPAVAVFSCGPNTAPDLTTLHRLQAAGAAVWRTDTQGTITITTGGHVSPVVAAAHL